jgi:transcription-repair coupling factor (superfamily II helicase)
MGMESLEQYVRLNHEYAYILDQIRQRKSNLVYGVTGAQKGFLAASMVWELNQSVLYVAETEQRGRELFDDLNFWLNTGERESRFYVNYFPSLDILPFEVIAQSKETRHKRMEVLWALLRMPGPVAVVTTLDALSQVLMEPASFNNGFLTLKVGERVEPGILASRLVELGYERAERVEEKGQFAARGGILDVFCPVAPAPWRMEFFDDEVDSIRFFSVETQRSTEKLKEIILSPAAEFFMDASLKEQAIQRLESEEKKYRNANRSLIERSQQIQEFLSEGSYFPGHEQLAPYFFQKKYSLLDYFKGAPLVILDEHGRQAEAAALRERETREIFVGLLEKGQILPGQAENYMSFDEWTRIFAQCRLLAFSLLPKAPHWMKDMSLLGVTAKTVASTMGKTQILSDELKEWRRLGYGVLIVINSRERGERLQDALRDMGIEVFFQNGFFRMQSRQTAMVLGKLTGGFEFPNWKLVVLSEAELFHQPKKRAPRKLFEEGKRVLMLEDLKPGDYVVHVSHGIGRYDGIENLTVGDAVRDYLVIRYQGEDRLYVPTDQASLLQKYNGQESGIPKLSKLGGNDWSRTRNKVKRAVQDLAEGLLALYAARESVQGFAFMEDTPWQKDFEEVFPYEETRDQLRSIEEVKQDMEKPQVMDRLLCGDVGYGKTEVAMRAAFKAVSSGKQVAVLVPTTVLAQQHFNTFRERFEGFAMTVSVLNRFKTPKEQKRILSDIKTGRADIVIGTHRLLSKDVEFKDLGLLVVDEEQRFGVTHKERIKQMRESVDVLTLTATPIPRTLHMSLTGLRDMSVIETPPEDRYPVQTFVVEHSMPMVREAVRRELTRGGQVYYVHNRIEDIDVVAAELQTLLPEARVVSAHGRMNEIQLERIMLAFMEGDVDVLVCTTIVESGLDVANANTLIVDNADRLGLAQLYQLRGRVGRSNRVAYAYLTYTKDKVLSEVAEKRLSAIRQFTELGAGFKIAMKDLEIRGAGNLLGPEQSGQIAAVGFDLYCRMLEEAIRERTGDQPSTEEPLSVEVQLKAYIPETYIEDEGTKIDFYQRINLIASPDEVDALREEMTDRFGDPPEPLENLLHIAVIKAAAKKARIAAIVQDQNHIKLKMRGDHALKGGQLMDLVRKYRRQVSFNAAADLEIEVDLLRMEKERTLDFLEELVSVISDLAEQAQTQEETRTQSQTQEQTRTQSQTRTRTHARA